MYLKRSPADGKVATLGAVVGILNLLTGETVIRRKEGQDELGKEGRRAREQKENKKGVPEIGDLAAALRADQDVSSRHIAVDEALGVAVGETIAAVASELELHRK
jgi:hypothetical protein